jgi:hypothetical protein
MQYEHDFTFMSHGHGLSLKSGSIATYAKKPFIIVVSEKNNLFSIVIKRKITAKQGPKT